MADPLLSAGGQVLTWYDYFFQPFEGPEPPEPPAAVDALGMSGGMPARRRRAVISRPLPMHAEPAPRPAARPDADDEEALLLAGVL